jgi:hypothetical protein
MAKKQEDGKGFYNKGKSTNLAEVTVTAKRPARKPMQGPKMVSDSASIMSRIKSPISNTKAPEPKKLGRLATAASDATSSMRGAANMAFGKNKSKTTGGKVLERGARLAATGLGFAGASGAAGASKAAISTAAKAGSLNPIGHAIVTGATVAAGQAMYKNRSAESTRKGLFNPGKGATYFEGTNFDKPFEKTKGRDMPLPDSSSLF